MLSPIIKTIGVVLSHTKYGDGSLIVNVFTQEMGRQAYIVSGMNGKKRKMYMPLLMPLSIVELTAYNSTRSTIHRVKEVHVHVPLVQLPFSPNKRTMAIFLTELMTKALKESGPDERLYSFVEQSVLALDAGMPGENMFHLFFMYNLTSLLGFGPDLTEKAEPYFNMLEGSCCSRIPMHRHVLASEDKKLFVSLSELTIDTLGKVRFTREEKHRLMEMMEEYYALHIANFGKLNSYEVLRMLNE